MPPKIRAFLTVTVIVVGTLLWSVRHQINLDAPSVLIFGLVASMGVAVWLFPEVKKDEGKHRHKP